MKHLLQNLENGETTIIDIPAPEVEDGHLLIETTVSLVSPGTEKMLIDFGNAGYLKKITQQPDKVKKVLDKVKTDGLLSTYEAVKSKLNMPISLGYCNVGKVIGIGNGVKGFSIGDRVASNGCHAEIVSVPTNLCVPIPENVSDEEASFVVLSSIGLQGIRLANPSIGEKFVVIGLGTIGLITTQILLANGCDVLAVDIQDDRLHLAQEMGAKIINSRSNPDYLTQIKNYSDGIGVDAVIISATSKGNKIISDAAKMSRKRGRIILVGVTGLNISRDDFYEKELSFQVSCSYGPGRYDPNYEIKGNDYPVGFVRWTEQRNFKAVIDLMSSKKIDLQPLITDKIPFKNAPELYKEIAKGKDGIGMILTYSDDISDKQIRLKKLSNLSSYSKKEIKPIIGFIGSGNYSSRFLMPIFKKLDVNLHTIVSKKGLTGTIFGNKTGFSYSSTNVNEVMNNEEINTIVIATRHDSHADLVKRGLEMGKNIYVEKPLAINYEDLELIKNEYFFQKKSNPDKKINLIVGFNRRFSSHIIKTKKILSDHKHPKTFIMTMNAGYIPHDHWVHDIKVGGGRIVGEACHYIDLMRYLANAKIENIHAEVLGRGQSLYTNDSVSLVLSFSDGSHGTINYLSNGSPSYPKERIEVFSGGRNLVIDNFNVLRGYGWKNFNKHRTLFQDKGQKKFIEGFISSLNTNESIIPIDEIFEVSEASIKVAEDIRN